ncbi:hypothetical protein [Thalassospira sp. MCCC 1A01428]|uniref:hypothetical protein n=1 Tax=Thalassospira sp. MCCC 1A01428 TaxID=1470575 RepID=UPI000A1E0094|nr:hypothetical protein [Thalassospira sp. MCCC 1A01428]OSQ44695.1 hypothetical protein THS27_05845 [Thalassospira sp. MCCC 1A01428]
MADKDKAVSTVSTDQDIASFVRQVQSVAGSAPASGPAQGRIVFAMDATASRQPHWDMAAHLQSEMFDAVAQMGALDIQLVFFRGFGECKASGWCRDAGQLRAKMNAVQCRAGQTQIGRVLHHVLNQNKKQPDHPVNALVYVGDCVEEAADDLAHLAGQLGISGTRVFVFQDGRDNDATKVFRDMARLGNGAFARLDGSAASVLRDFLGGVASFILGGFDALNDYNKTKSSSDIHFLTDQLRRKR